MHHETLREEETRKFVIGETERYFQRQISSLKDGGLDNKHIFSDRYFKKIQVKNSHHTQKNSETENLTKIKDPLIVEDQANNNNNNNNSNFIININNEYLSNNLLLNPNNPNEAQKANKVTVNFNPINPN